MDVAQDVVISEIDCGTINGIVAADLKEGEDIIEPLSERILGRTILEDFIEDGKVLIKAGTMIRDEEAKIVFDSNIESLRIRSVLTCESLRRCLCKVLWLESFKSQACRSWYICGYSGCSKHRRTRYSINS